MLGHALGGVGKQVGNGMKSVGTGLTRLAGGIGAIATAVLAGKSGYEAGKSHNWNWGSFLSSTIGGAVSGGMMPGGNPLGILGGALAGGAIYGGGYAFGSKSSGGGYGATASLSVQNASPMAAYALATAASQIGTPYAWGGGTINGPTRGFAQGAGTVGFDCSSFVQYVFAKQGINLPRTT